MSNHAEKLGRVFWIQWVLATAAGLGAGFALGWVVGDFTGSALGVAIGKGVVWPAVGTVQWLLLRDKLTKAGGWIVAYVGAGTLVGAFAFAVGWSLGDVPAAIGGIFLGVMVGTVAGAIQWRVLRRDYSGSGWWVLVSTFGWVFGLAAGFGLAHTMGLAGPTGGAGVVPQTLVGVMAGLVCGALTGVALIQLSPKASQSPRV